MVDALGMLQCPVCSAFYKPETTATGRVIPHCVPPITRVQWIDGEVYVDWDTIEARVVGSLLTDDVVDLPLTGAIVDIEV
jgi:hypothetical protein